jgi:tRNA-splicing endonuclease subunit Sen15
MATNAATLPPTPSPLTKLFSANPSTDPLHTLALQIQHNLAHQHTWTSIRLHTHSPLTNRPLPCPLLSGLPPLRLYTHPDEQVQLLKEAEARRKAARSKQADKQESDEEAEAEAEGLDVQVETEREWVVPTRLSERWSLRRLAEVFDAVGVVPPAAVKERGGDEKENKWRKTKRVVLATVDSDSTVVYYIVHDGVVKPRQN